MIEKGWIEATRQQNRERAVSAVIAMSDALRSADAEIDRLTRERDEAREALRVFGRHLDSCGDADAYNHAEVAQCGCGFDAALAGTADQPTAALTASHRLHNICNALSEQADESPFTREEWERIDAENVSLTAENKRLKEWIANPPRHQWWGAGEPDCPKDIKGGNGELHTLRCKVCGEGPKDEICRAAVNGNAEP